MKLLESNDVYDICRDSVEVKLTAINHLLARARYSRVWKDHGPVADRDAAWKIIMEVLR